MFDWSLKKKPTIHKPLAENKEDLKELFFFDENKPQENHTHQKYKGFTPPADSGYETTLPLEKENERLEKPRSKFHQRLSKMIRGKKDTVLIAGKQVIVPALTPPIPEKEEKEETIRNAAIYKEISSESWDYPAIINMLNDMDTTNLFKEKITSFKKLPALSGAFGEVKEKRNTLDDDTISNLINKRFPPLRSGKDNFDKTLISSFSPYANVFTYIKDPKPALIVDDFGDRSLWELQLNNSNLPGMELQEVKLINMDFDYKNELRRNYRRARRDFLKYIGYDNTQDLYAAGLTDIDISMLKKGMVCENFNVHRKVPYEYGGNNDFNNLCLIQTHPYHDNLHKFLDMQIFIHPVGAKVKRLFIPIPSGKVYVPYLDITGSGGKSKHDRSVFAGFQKETLDLIAQKTSIGKAAEL